MEPLKTSADPMVGGGLRPHTPPSLPPSAKVGGGARSEADERIMLSPVLSSRKAARGSRWGAYLPVCLWLPPYLAGWRENLRFDLMSALTITCLAVPQSMAYAMLAGVPPI